MRNSLQDALYQAHPGLFRQRTLPLTESGMGRGFECGDGWYGILDGLCDALTTHSRQTGHPPIVAVQVKEKLGDLRFYVDGDCEWCRGAIDFSSAMSRHVCEETGRPGMLMIRARRIRTLAEDVGYANGYRRPETEAEERVEDGPKPTEEGLPPGWLTIASVLMSIVAQRMPHAALRFGCGDGELVVDSQNNEAWLSGSIACARALSTRTDPVTGVMRIPSSDD